MQLGSEYFELAFELGNPRIFRSEELVGGRFLVEELVLDGAYVSESLLSD